MMTTTITVILNIIISLIIGGQQSLNAVCILGLNMINDKVSHSNVLISYLVEIIMCPFLKSLLINSFRAILFFVVVLVGVVLVVIVVVNTVVMMVVLLLSYHHL